jgi:hypothetical protein
MLQSAMERYWETSRSVHRWRSALLGENATFRDVVIGDHFRMSRSRHPIAGETAQRAAAALTWLFNAQDASSDGGVAYGYFPVSSARGWDVSYPETTGYIMTSLVEYGRSTDWAEPIERARRMALWEAEVQMPNGAVQGGKLTSRDKQTPAAFNTGMVLDGFVTVLEERADAEILRAAERVAEFLAADLNSEGLFVTNGEFVSKDAIKVYNVLCAWALHRFGALIRMPRYCDLAVKAVKGALRFQNPNGWFSENCLTDSLHPLTHTIGYTVQGVMEVGIAAGREDFIAACERTWGAIVSRIHENGYLPGRFDKSWRPAAKWSCLTGSAQLAIVGYRLSQVRAEARHAQAADRLVDWLKGVQRLQTGNPGIDGALAGSFPIMGGYMTGGYPNWATKYFLDALMAQAQRSGERLLVITRRK